MQLKKLFLIKLDWESIRLIYVDNFTTITKRFWVENKNVAEFTEFCFLSHYCN